MLTIAGLRDDYRSGRREPGDVVASIFARIAESGSTPDWILLADEASTVARARSVDPALPLAGIPFAVKDNMDVAGLPTTAGCPSFAYTPDRHATVVGQLLDAGAVLIGKTNMDQFATGLVGTRSPYGVCASVFDDRYISGGSSSGSAVVVGKGLAAFSLGTDTAGSGRIPAAFNGLVGLKPTRGVVSSTGIVPACRSLDCVSVFAHDATDAESVFRVLKGVDRSDSYSRAFVAPPSPWQDGSFRFGVPKECDLEFFGDEENRAIYLEAVARCEAIGGTRVTIDFAPFRAAAELLYSGPWVAERYASVGPFLDTAPLGVDPTVSHIIRSASKYSAVDTFQAFYRLEALSRAAELQWAAMDLLLLPTAGTQYLTADVLGDPVRLNTNLGYYTNFVNLMDLAAVAAPSGRKRNGLAFGVSLIGRSFTDHALLSVAARFARGRRTADTPAPYTTPELAPLAR